MWTLVRKQSFACIVGKPAENDVKLGALKLKPNTKIMMMGTREESLVNVYFCYICPIEDACVLSRSVMSDSLRPYDCSPSDSSVHGIFPARIPEWVASSSSRGSSRPRDQTHVSFITGGFFTTEPPRKLSLWRYYDLYHIVTS